MICHTRKNVQVSYDPKQDRILIDVNIGTHTYGVTFHPDDPEGFKFARENLLDKITGGLPHDIMMAYFEVKAKIPET